MLHRTPAVDALRQYTRSIINAMFKLLEMDNEENVLVCLRIIIEMHKQFRPAHTPEVGYSGCGPSPDVPLHTPEVGDSGCGPSPDVPAHVLVGKGQAWAH